jgi:hypothetical protein
MFDAVNSNVHMYMYLGIHILKSLKLFVGYDFGVTSNQGMNN